MPSSASTKIKHDLKRLGQKSLTQQLFLDSTRADVASQTPHPNLPSTLCFSFALSQSNLAQLVIPGLFSHSPQCFSHAGCKHCLLICAQPSPKASTLPWFNTFLNYITEGKGKAFILIVRTWSFLSCTSSFFLALTHPSSSAANRALQQSEGAHSVLSWGFRTVPITGSGELRNRPSFPISSNECSSKVCIPSSEHGNKENCFKMNPSLDRGRA